MFMLITYTERNLRTGRLETLVSHGVDLSTDRVVTLPPESPAALGARFDQNSGEWVLS